MVFNADTVEPLPGSFDRTTLSPTPPLPLASSLIGAFGDWGRKSGGWTAGGENQAKVSVGLFIEVCGDRPIDTYTRADGDTLRDTLRKLPNVYRKSANDRAKSLTQIIAEADTAKSPRITERP